MITKGFDIPKSIDEAEERVLLLQEEVENIQAQLGSKVRKADPRDGHEMTSEEYAEWRFKAHIALTKKLNELRRLKHWMKVRGLGAL